VQTNTDQQREPERDRVPERGEAEQATSKAFVLDFAGLTNNDLFQACRGSKRLNAASSARSACVSCGRAT
jgi:hypothetical protein